jgi:MSHA biogenesis protein MshJ
MQQDPDADVKARLAEAKARLALMDADLSNLHKKLVAPDKMDALLQNILKRNKRLQLISLKSLPVMNLYEIEKTTEGAATAQTTAQASAKVTTELNQVALNKLTTINPDELSIYKHEVELVLEGNYLDMLAYTKDLESMPEQVYWSRANLQVIEYPKARLSLQIFTLSLERKWLNL